MIKARMELTKEERSFLLRLIAEHVNYFRMLAGNKKVTEKTRAEHAMIEQLSAKLQ